MVTEENSLEEIKAYFNKDRFAAAAQCSIIEAKANHSVCRMPITPEHLNANGTVMGGALFTLADFTMAVASNLDGKSTVSIDCSIRFFRPAKGNELIATCSADKAGRSVGFYTVEIADEQGALVAEFTSTAHRS